MSNQLDVPQDFITELEAVKKKIRSLARVAVHRGLADQASAYKWGREVEDIFRLGTPRTAYLYFEDTASLKVLKNRLDTMKQHAVFRTPDALARSVAAALNKAYASAQAQQSNSLSHSGLISHRLNRLYQVETQGENENGHLRLV